LSSSADSEAEYIAEFNTGFTVKAELKAIVPSVPPQVEPLYFLSSSPNSEPVFTEELSTGTKWAEL